MLTPLIHSEALKVQTLRALVDIYISLLETKDSTNEKLQKMPALSELQTLIMSYTYKAKAIAAAEAAVKLGSTFLANRELMLLDSQYYLEIVKMDVRELLSVCEKDINSEARKKGLALAPASLMRASRAMEVELLLNRKRQTDEACEEILGVINIADNTIDRSKLEPMKEGLLAKGMPEEQYNNLTAADASGVYLAFKDASRCLAQSVMDMGETNLNHFLKCTKLDKRSDAEKALNDCRLNVAETSNYDHLRKTEVPSNN